MIPLFSRFPWRDRGYALLSGNGVEIGALHEPAIIPAGVNVSYVDVVTREEAISFFPELDSSLHKDFVKVDHIVNIEKEGLRKFQDSTLDFVILNHVLEHIANPIFVLGECFRVIKAGGRLVISIPDKRFTFDKNRDITTLDHLWSEYDAGVNEVSDDHYVDFLHGVHPHLATLSPSDMQIHIEGVRRRREHAHVWDSFAWEQFLTSVFEKCKIQAICLYKVTGDETNFEYFAVWRKEAMEQ